VIGSGTAGTVGLSRSPKKNLALLRASSRPARDDE
jgi:hypothetical protein